MPKFFFADGTVEEHPVRDDSNWWQLHREPPTPLALRDIEPDGFLEIETATFRRMELGDYWQTEPLEFDPEQALCNLADEVAELKSQRLRLCRGIHMFMMDGVDPSVAYDLLRAPEFKDVRWWDFGPEDDS